MPLERGEKVRKKCCREKLDTYFMSKNLVVFMTVKHK
jgi:hypothetical protein